MSGYASLAVHNGTFAPDGASMRKKDPATIVWGAKEVWLLPPIPNIYKE
jgi:hypothetical protein